VASVHYKKRGKNLPLITSPQTSHYAGAYDTMYVFLFNPKAAKYFLRQES
jgi:hypothetical protein